MSDLIELITWPKMQLVFYKVTSSGFWFDIKASGCAAVGLAKEPGTKYKDLDYLIAMERNRTWIRKLHEADESEPVSIPGLINGEEFKRFWLTWHGGYIKLGLVGRRIPIVKYRIRQVNLQYLTFVMLEGRGAIFWRFELPPLLEKPRMKAIMGGKPEWVQVKNRLPEGSFIGGYEHESLYIIRAIHMGSLTSGKYVPSEGVGYVPWGGRANAKRAFEALVGHDCVWVPTAEDKIPLGAVVAGFTENYSETLYVGRAMHDGHIIPGKVQPSHKVCYVPFEDREVAFKDYEVLVTPNFNENSGNRYISNEVTLEDFQLVVAIQNNDFVSEDEED